MSTLREAAQAALEQWDKVSGVFRMTAETEALRSALAQPPAAPDAEVRAQHKEFARWFLELGDKSALASEYLAWLAWKAALAHPPRDEWREAAEEALRWMEHARLHLTIKERMHPDGLGLYDNAAEALRAALAKPEADAPRDEWRPASEPPEDAMFSRGAVADIVAGALYSFVAFLTTRSPAISIGETEECGPVVDLIPAFAEQSGLSLDNPAVQSWHLCIGRDVTPPTEDPIAAKCQRVEGSGEICGLTPPCPDCGSSLIDVADGSL